MEESIARGLEAQGIVGIVHGTSDRTVPYTCGLRSHQTWKQGEWHLPRHYDHPKVDH